MEEGGERKQWEVQERRFKVRRCMARPRSRKGRERGTQRVGAGSSSSGQDLIAREAIVGRTLNRGVT